MIIPIYIPGKSVKKYTNFRGSLNKKFLKQYLNSKITNTQLVYNSIS